MHFLKLYRKKILLSLGNLHFPLGDSGECFTAALHKLTPSRLLAVLFLLFIGYVACAPFPQFLSNTKALFTEGISPRNDIRSIDDQYSGMLSTEKEKPLLQNKGTYINLNGLMARFLKQPSMNNCIRLRNDSAPERKQFLLIGDSFGNVPFSLLSLYVSKCDELDMRLFSGSFASYYETCGPDTVILLINVNGILDTNASYPYFSEKTVSVN